MRDLFLGKSKTRAAIFRLFFSAPDREYYLRELERLLNLPVGNVRRELSKLEKAGIFKSRRVGNLRYFSVATEHPLFREYSSIVFKTIGIAGTLASALEAVGSVNIAFIFGSVAEKTDRPGSDIDLFVIGGIGSRKLHQLISPIRSRLGREINVVLFDRREFRNRLEKRDHFVSSVMEKPKEYVKGNEDGLRRLAS